MFGEHIINRGAKGLALPFDKFTGVLKFAQEGDKVAQASNKSIAKLAHHIVHDAALSERYDTNNLLEDIERGLYFDSDIPQGYGLGSSGALVAAIYYQYRIGKRKSDPISDIKSELATLESFFHGKSSGLDPIVCYLDKTVILNGGQVTDAFKLPEPKSAALKVFLINTHIERKTSPYVNMFLDKCKDKKFMETIEKSLVPANDMAIDNFLNKKHAPLMSCVKLISQLHLDMMPEFIPDKFKEAWKHGLKYNEYHLKICGAGGGGFIIGFAKADAKLDLLLDGKNIVEWMKF